NVSNNEFIATNQFTVKQGDHVRRPDITLFINGLPLVTFELKNPTNANVGIQQAFSQLETYKTEIPEYMQYNEILIISDGINARAGSLTAGIDRFMRWREPKEVAVDRSEEHTSELQSRFEVVCRLLLEKNNIKSHMSQSVIRT